MKLKLSRLIALASLIAIFNQTASAHFPWLAKSEDGKAILFFGEDLTDRNYHMPPALAEASIKSHDGDASEAVDLQPVESEEWVGLESLSPVGASTTLASQVTYGVYHGALLKYYAQHVGEVGAMHSNENDRKTRFAKLQARLFTTDEGLTVAVDFEDKPLADVEVKLFCEDGHEEGAAKTDERGHVTFSAKQVEEGLNALLVGHTIQGTEGTHGDQKYGSTMHYLTVTFESDEKSDGGTHAEKDGKESDLGMKKTPASSPIQVVSDAYPIIPESVTSFGAAVTDEAIYVYGGHMGEAHSYSGDVQGKTLYRLDLKSPEEWKAVAHGPGLQGLAMVTHGGKLYRIGGFTAKNEDGEEHNLWSQAGVACFDMATQAWTDLPELPEPRSSFDAAVLGDCIYVMGGWTMRGQEGSTWLQTAYRMDLSQESPSWQPLSEPPFRRRALSIAAHDGKVYAIGGMQEQGGPFKGIDVYDPATDSWSKGPELNGEMMDGFGSSSFAVGGNLYASTYSGHLQRLSSNGSEWELLGTLEKDRFFHRLLPLSDHQLVSLGGASMTSGKFVEVDVIEVR